MEAAMFEYLTLKEFALFPLSVMIEFEKSSKSESNIEGD